jgi:hypothetical protein
MFHTGGRPAGFWKHYLLGSAKVSGIAILDLLKHHCYNRKHRWAVQDGDYQASKLVIREYVRSKVVVRWDRHGFQPESRHGFEIFTLYLFGRGLIEWASYWPRCMTLLEETVDYGVGVLQVGKPARCKVSLL